MSRRSFWPTVLVGVGGAGLAALAAHKPWAAVTNATGTGSGVNRPEVAALAFVTLALWGVLLVTRGIVRRVVAALTVVAAVATMAFAVHALAQSPASNGGGWFSYSSKGPEFHRTVWGWLATVGAALTTLAALVALRATPGWPEMGRKYDAPSGPAAPAVPLEQQEALDVWKAMDRGVDPTADGSE